MSPLIVVRNVTPSRRELSRIRYGASEINLRRSARCADTSVPSALARTTDPQGQGWGWALILFLNGKARESRPQDGAPVGHAVHLNRGDVHLQERF